MKIAHVADSHWGLGYPGPNPYSRFEDISRAMNWIADRIIEEGCEVVLFAGDAFKDARIFIDRATIEIAAFTHWLRRLSNAGCKTVVISGTPSHDAVSAYELIKEMNIPNVTIFTSPGGIILGSPDNELSISCLPGMNRSQFATQEEFKDLPPNDFHQKMTEWIYGKCKELGSQSRGTKMLMSHLTFDLADTGFEDVLLMNEPILSDEAAQLFDLVALGHIHRPQQAGNNVFYSGAPERHNFGDERTTPGFWIHTLTSKQTFASRFIETPSRIFKTIDWCDMDIEAWLDGQVDEFATITDAIVRVRYTCSEELQKRFDRRTLEKSLYDAGAFYVHEIKADIERSDRVRDVEVNESLGPQLALAKWGQNQSIDLTEISELQALTAEILEAIV
ncbi:metallophosphoesterase family protein [Paenibacillus ferrarius]|uniref:metallophosphoesterase family protein n=1 Tax=Paenibacillus ferrarius TaxID=1469647 RepID=UPI003D2C5B1B